MQAANALGDWRHLRGKRTQRTSFAQRSGVGNAQAYLSAIGWAPAIVGLAGDE